MAQYPGFSRPPMHGGQPLQLHLTIVGARSLRESTRASMFGGGERPYVKVQLGAREVKTRSAATRGSPTWNERFTFAVHSQASASVKLSVKQATSFGKAVLGSCLIRRSRSSRLSRCLRRGWWRRQRRGRRFASTGR